MDNGAEEDRWIDVVKHNMEDLYSSTWRMPRIELNGEGEPVWLTFHLRDPQPEGERERLRSVKSVSKWRTEHLNGIGYEVGMETETGGIIVRSTGPVMNGCLS